VSERNNTQENETQINYGHLD